MSNPKIVKYLNYALKGVLYLILITPLLVSGKYLFPFITTKTIFFRLMAELAVLLYVVLVMLAKEFKPRMTKLSWAVVIFGIIIFITGITGIDFYKTFWGTIERGEGFLTISHLIIYFLLLTWTFKTRKEWLNYLTGASIAGLLVVFYALLQRAGVEKFLFFKIFHAGEERLSATIGNAAFMGAFVLAQFFINLLLFFKRQSWWKNLFGLGILLNFFVLYQTQTRGALLAWIFVFILLCLVYVIKSKDRIKKYSALGILIVILVSSALVWFNRHADWVKNNNTLFRLTSISRTDITTESRLLAVKTSWNGWKDRFILGYGWENYNIAFNKYFPAEIYMDAGSQLWFDRAHNTVFDVAVATGIFGLINYLIIFGLALHYLFKNIKRDFDFSIILMALLVGHFIQNIFVFDVLSTYILLFLILAVVVSNELNYKDTIDEFQNQSAKDFNVLIFLPVLLIIIFLVYVFNLKPLQANSLGVRGMVYINSGQVNQGVSFFKQGIEMKTYQTPELRQKLADGILNYNKPNNNLTQAEIYKNYQVAIEEIKKNISDKPLDVQNYLYLLAILNRTGIFDQTYFDQVLEWGEQALKLSPTRPQIYFEMGQSQILQKKYEAGIKYIQQGVALNPTTLEAHFVLLGAYVLANENNLAEETYRYMEEHKFNFKSVVNLNRLYSLYLSVSDNDKLLEIIQKIIEVQPTGGNYARLAAIYKELGKYENARQAVLKAVELEPGLAKEAEMFLQSLR